MKTIKYIIQLIAVTVMTFSGYSCVKVDEPSAYSEVTEYPEIYPDYINVTIPVNIAPLRFGIKNAADESVVVIEGKNGKSVIGAEDNKFLIKEKDWKQIVGQSAGDSVCVRVYSKKEGKWFAYKPFSWYISHDEIDQWLVYRLIAPGYELWNKMGIYQRNLSTYSENVIISNENTENNCINCHSFSNNSPENMSFHMRAKLGGTYIKKEGNIKKIIPSEISKVKSFVYPSWHPSGRYIAYSSNDTKQAFHLSDSNRIEVYDLSSDVIVFDTQAQKVLTDSLLFSSSSFETFPAFTPDGKSLLFCTAEKRNMPQEFKEVKYSICSIGFDPISGTFSSCVDTIYNCNIDNGSASFPRVSPDGKFMVFTKSNYGNFSIWHKESDLYIYDYENKTITEMKEANSNDVDSYHSWSSNSRWLVFSSRRMDGLYTSPYIVHIDKNGKCSKAFVIPQEDPDFYKKFMYSFNIPELVKEKVEVDTKELLKVCK